MILETDSQEPTRQNTKSPSAFNRVFRVFTIKNRLSVRQIADDLNGYVQAHPSARRSGVDYYSPSTIQSYRRATMPDDPFGFVDLCRAAIKPPRDATQEIPDSAWDALKNSIYVAHAFAAGQRFLRFCDEDNPGIRSVLNNDLRERLAGWLREVGLTEAEIEDITRELAQHEP